MIQVLHETRSTSLTAARADVHALWLDRDELMAATGWDWKPEGLCRDEVCMPVPRTVEPAMVQGERIDIAAFWRHAGWPVAHDRAAQIWVLGEGAAQRADALTTLQAPDFALPDLDGQIHRLSDYRGQRVFLSTWAAW